MGNPGHVDGFRGVVDFVDGPVITDPDTPFLIAALELFAARRPWRVSETFQTGHNAGDRFRG